MNLFSTVFVRSQKHIPIDCEPTCTARILSRIKLKSSKTNATNKLRINLSRMRTNGEDVETKHSEGNFNLFTQRLCETLNLSGKEIHGVKVRKCPSRSLIRHVGAKKIAQNSLAAPKTFFRLRCQALHADVKCKCDRNV